MREIKFRAYYQKVTDDSWVIEGEYTLKDLTDKGIQFDQERIEWVQYTGLKDKDGKEIYEGDICRWLGFEVRNSRQIRPERIFHVDGEIYNLFQLKNIIEGNSQNTLKIIGNIYLNPELLSDTKESVGE